MNDKIPAAPPPSIAGASSFTATATIEPHPVRQRQGGGIKIAAAAPPSLFQFAGLNNHDQDAASMLNGTIMKNGIHSTIPLNGGINTNMNMNMNANINTKNNNQHYKNSKRRHYNCSSPSDKCIVSGQSFKRLRLDPQFQNQNNNSIGGSSASAAGGAININGAASNNGVAGVNPVTTAAGGLAMTMMMNSSAQSTGTLSVGVESNDEDDGGDYYDDCASEEEEAEEEEAESCGSSFLASLPSLGSHLRRRRCVGLSSGSHGQAASFPLHEDDDDDDDAATCAAMTTAAVAPRRHHARNRSSPIANANNNRGDNCNGTGISTKRKRRAIAFVIDTSSRNNKNDAIKSSSDTVCAKCGDDDYVDNDDDDNDDGAAAGIRDGNGSIAMDENGMDSNHYSPGKKKMKKKSKIKQIIMQTDIPIQKEERGGETESSLEVEESSLGVDSLSLDVKLVTFESPHNPTSDIVHRPYREQQSMSPPVDCIPDPLLVAAQHAAGGGMGIGMGASAAAAANASDMGAKVSFKEDSTTHANASSSAAGVAPTAGTEASNWSLLVMGDCCSSVTEEETSLAEDEASLSAISIGENTTMSAGGDIATTGTVSGLSAGGTHGGPDESEASLVGAASFGGLSDCGKSNATDGMMMMEGDGNSNRKKPPLSLFHSTAKEAVHRSDSRGTTESMDDDVGVNNNKNTFKPIQQLDQPCGQSIPPVVAPKMEHTAHTLSSGYAPLNHVLGVLHKERQHRRPSSHLPPPRRESSINSLRRDCVGGGTGRIAWTEDERSYCSLPGNVAVTMNSSAP